MDQQVEYNKVMLLLMDSYVASGLCKSLTEALELNRLKESYCTDNCMNQQDISKLLSVVNSLMKNGSLDINNLIPYAKFVEHSLESHKKLLEKNKD